MNRAYSVLTTKSFDEEERVIRGVATCPEMDRDGDVIVPTGVQFKNPMPLLWQHQREKPVGRVSFDPPTPAGVTFEARMPRIEEPGPLKDRVDEAWQSVKSGLVTAVSIGFRPIAGAVEHIKGGGMKFLQTEVIELSLVTIPANSGAVITAIKSMDQQHQAPASGPAADPAPPGVTGTPPAAPRGPVKLIPRGNTP